MTAKDRHQPCYREEPTSGLNEVREKETQGRGFLSGRNSRGSCSVEALPERQSGPSFAFPDTIILPIVDPCETLPRSGGTQEGHATARVVRVQLAVNPIVLVLAAG